MTGVPISGTLTLPQGTPRVIAITVHGSFVQTRDGDLDPRATWMFPQGVPARRLFKDIGEALLVEGIASYRYDKRASGRSGGDYAATDMIRLATDLREIATQVRRRYPSSKIVVIGQSEGGLTAVKAAEMGAPIDFLVLQGAALVPFGETMEFQRTRAAKPFLDGSPGLREQHPYISALYEALFRGDLVAQARDTDRTVYELRIGSWSHTTSLAKYRHYLQWNGLAILENLKVPAYVLFGELDGNVNPDVIERIRAGQKAGKFAHVRTHVFPGLEHSFRKPGANFVESMRQPLDPAYTTFLRSILRENLGGGRCPLE